MIWLLLACLPDLGPESAAAHAGRCGDCHPTHSEAFAGSRHAQASSSPTFQALRDHAEASQGLGATCDRCHAPAGTGLGCLTCHAAAGNQRPANGELLHDPTGPIRGPFGDTEASHASVASDFLTDAQLCATCHELDGLGAFDESPYQHWQRSEAAAEGHRCQDCHMGAVPGQPVDLAPGAVVVGGVDRPLSDHAFVGLQADPVALLTAGLELRAVAGGVELVNHAGHALPDGASFSRELWLEVRRDGHATGEVHPLHPELLDATGAPTWDPTTAASVTSRALAPDEVRFVPLAADTTLCLRYRPVAAKLSAGLDLPTTEAIDLGCAG